jgi:hypothetical protein
MPSDNLVELEKVLPSLEDENKVLANEVRSCNSLYDAHIFDILNFPNVKRRQQMKFIDSQITGKSTNVHKTPQFFQSQYQSTA